MGALLLCQPTYHSWFKDVLLEISDDEIVILKVENAFKRDYLEHHFLEQIKGAVQLVCPEVRGVELQITAPHNHIDQT